MWHVCVFVGLCLNLRELGNVFAKTYWVVAQPACAASAFAEPDKDFKLPTSQGHFWFFFQRKTQPLCFLQFCFHEINQSNVKIDISQKMYNIFNIYNISYILIHQDWTFLDLSKCWKCKFKSYSSIIAARSLSRFLLLKSIKIVCSRWVVVRGGWSLTFGSYVTLARPVGKPISYNCASFTTPFQSALRTTAFTRNPRMR